MAKAVGRLGFAGIWPCGFESHPSHSGLCRMQYRLLAVVEAVLQAVEELVVRREAAGWEVVMEAAWGGQ